MAVDPATIQSIVQISQIGLQLVERYEAGELTDEEFQAELEEMRTGLDEANRRWELARGQK